MTRVKRGVASNKKRKNLLEDAKGYRWKRSTLYRTAKQAVIKAGVYAFRDRRAKKRTMRRLWITRLGIATRELGVKYNQLIHTMTTKNIEVDRKVLSQLAMENPTIFAKFVEKVK
jgi:large subunit ribosomal protein L20